MAMAMTEFPKVDWKNIDNSEIQIEHYYRLVYVICKRFNPPNGMDIDDMFQTGCVGLVKAYKSFKPDKGVKFSTYAGRCITNEIFMVLRKAKSSGNFGHYGSVSMDMMLIEGIEDDKLQLHGLIRDPANVEDIVITKMIEETMFEGLQCRPIVREVGELMMFGLTQREIADIYGLTQSYVSRLALQFKKEMAKRMNIIDLPKQRRTPTRKVKLRIKKEA